MGIKVELLFFWQRISVTSDVYRDDLWHCATRSDLISTVALARCELSDPKIRTVVTAMTYLTHLTCFAPKGLRLKAQGCRFGYPGTEER
jgi:hypothetical protein